MSKIIKLSKSDWMRIGRESGYIKEAFAFPPAAMELVDDKVRLDDNNVKFKYLHNMLTALGDKVNMLSDEVKAMQNKQV